MRVSWAVAALLVCSPVVAEPRPGMLAVLELRNKLGQPDNHAGSVGRNIAFAGSCTLGAGSTDCSALNRTRVGLSIGYGF